MSSHMVKSILTWFPPWLWQPNILGLVLPKSAARAAESKHRSFGFFARFRTCDIHIGELKTEIYSKHCSVRPLPAKEINYNSFNLRGQPKRRTLRLNFTAGCLAPDLLEHLVTRTGSLSFSG